MTGRPRRERIHFVSVLCGAVVLNVLLLIAPLLLVTGYEMHVNSRLATFVLLVSVWCAVEGSVGCGGTACVKTAAGPRRLPLVIGLTLLGTFWVGLFDAVVFSRAPSLIAVAVGVVLMAAGITLRLLAIRRLGAFFLNEVAVLPGQPLVTDGIYGAMRHPSETGTLCLAFAGAVLLGSPLAGLACLFVLLPCVVWRTRLEDGLLRERHPDAFERYVRGVPGFLPGVRPGSRKRLIQGHLYDTDLRCAARGPANHSFRRTTSRENR